MNRRFLCELTETDSLEVNNFYGPTFELLNVNTSERIAPIREGSDPSCLREINNLICKWVAYTINLHSAECATCDPDCLRLIAGPCVQLISHLCGEVAGSCTCDSNKRGPSQYGGHSWACWE